MNSIRDAAQAIRQRLEGGSSPPVSPNRFDDLLNDLHELLRHDPVLHKLATHYGVPYVELRDLLIARQCLFIYAHTDWTKKGDRSQLQAILRYQHAELDKLIQRLSQTVDKLAELIEAARALHDQAHSVLARYRDEPTQPGARQS